MTIDRPWTPGLVETVVDPCPSCEHAALRHNLLTGICLDCEDCIWTEDDDDDVDE